MATEADIPAPVCETRGEEGGEMVDQARNTSINKIHKEEEIRAESLYEFPETLESNFDVKHMRKGNESSEKAIEAEHFLRSPSITEPSGGANNILSDACKVTEYPVQIAEADIAISHLRDTKVDDHPIEDINTEENSCDTSNLDRERKESEVPSVSESENLNLEAMVSKDKSDNTKTTDVLILTDDVSEGGCPSEQNVADKENGENAKEEDSSFLKSKVTDDPNSVKVGSDEINSEAIRSNDDITNSYIVKEAMIHDGNATPRAPKPNPTEGIEHKENNGSAEKDTSTEIMINETSKKYEFQGMQDTESSSIQENNSNIQREGTGVTTWGDCEMIIDNATEKESKTQEEDVIIQSIPTALEQAEDTSSTQAEVSQLKNNDHSEKENNMLTEATKDEINNDASTDTHKVSLEDHDQTKAGVLTNEKNINVILVKEEAQTRKSAEFLRTAVEDISAPALGQDTDTTSLEDGQITADPREIPSEETEERAADAVDTKKESLEVKNVSTTDLYEETEENTMIEVDDSQVKNLEKESKEPTVRKAPNGDNSSDEKVVIDEPKTENEEVNAHSRKSVESLHIVPEDIKASPSSQCMETTNSLQDQNITTDHKEILEDKIEGKTMDAVQEEETLNVQQNVTIAVPKQESEENSFIQVDGSQMNNVEHFTENEKPSSAEASDKGANDDRSIIVHKLENEDEELRRAELFDNEENTECSLGEEEAPEEKPVDSLHETAEDIKVFALSQENETTNILENDSLNANPGGVSDDKTEEKTLDEADKKEETLQTESTLTIAANEDTEKNSSIHADDSQMVFLEKESEKSSLTETLAGFTDADPSKLKHDAKANDEDLREAEFKKNLGSTVHKNEVPMEKPTEYKQEGPGVTEAPASCEDIDKAGSLEDESLTINPQGTLDNRTEEKIAEATDTKEVNLLKEEAQMEKSVEFLHTAVEDINASALGQDTDTTSLEDGRLTVDPRETPSEETEERAADAVDAQEERLQVQDVAPTVSYEETEESSMIEVDDCQVKNLEKESKEPTMRKAPAGNDSDAGKVVIDKPKIENEEIYAHTQKSVESLRIVPEDIQASPSIQCMETTISLQEQNITPDHQEILDDKIEGKTMDAVKEKETLNVQESEEYSLKNEEHFMENEKPSLVEVINKDANDDKSIIIHKLEIEDEDLRRAELFENEESAEGSLLTEEGLEEKPAESLHVAAEGMKAFPSSQENETTNSLENDRLNANPEGILDDTVEEKTIDEADPKEQTPQAEKVPTIVPYKDTEENTLIHADGSQMLFLEKEIQKPSLTETSAVAVFTDADLSEVMYEVKTGDEDLREAEFEKVPESTELKKEAVKETPTQYTQGDPEDASCQDIDTHSCVGDENITANPQETLDNRTEENRAEATDTKKETCELQNVSTTVPNDETAENSSTNEDDSQTKHEEHLVKEREEPTLGKAPTKEAGDGESRVTHEPKVENEDLRESDLSENPLLKEDAQTEKSVESLKIVANSTETSVSSQNMETTSTLEEQSLTSDTQGIQDDNLEETKMVAVEMKETSNENIAKYAPNEETKESILIQVEDSQVKHEEHIKKESEKPSQMEASSRDTNVDESIIMQNIEIEEDQKRAESLENENGTKYNPLKKEAQEKNTVEMLHVAPEDDKTFASNEDIGIINSLPEQSLTENSHESLDYKTNEKTNDEANQKEKSLEVQNFTASVSNEEPKEDTSIQVDSSEIEHSEKEKKLESTSEALTGFHGADFSEVVDVPDTREEDLKETELSHSETSIESALLKKEAQVETLTEYMQADPDDIKASASSQDTNTSSLEEHSVDANPQAIVGDQKEKTIDAADMKEESLEAQKVATIISIGNTEDNSYIHEDRLKMKNMECLEKERDETSLSEASQGAAKDDESIMEETISVDENETKVEFSRNEKSTENTLAKEERQIDEYAESLQPPEDVKYFVSNNDIDMTSSQDPLENLGDQREATTTGETDKGETPETQKVFTTALGDTEQNQLIQVDDSQMKHDEHLEIQGETVTETLTRNNCDDESTIMHEARIGIEDIAKAELLGKEKNTDSTLLKQRAEMEKPFESLQVAPEDIKAIASVLDTETSSLENQILSVNPEGTLGDKAEDETTDAADIKEESLEAQNTTIISNEVINSVISHCNANNQSSSGAPQEEKSSESVSNDVNQIQDVNGARKTLESTKNTSTREVVSIDILLPGEVDVGKPEGDSAFEFKEISQEENAGSNMGETNLQLGALPCGETSELKSGEDKVSTLEEVSPVKDIDICNSNDQSNNVENQDQENIVESHGASEVQSLETKDEVQEEPETTSKDTDIHSQIIDNKHHITAHSEATTNETVETFQETTEIDRKASSEHIDKDQVEGRTADANQEEKALTEIPIQEVREIHQESDGYTENFTQIVNEGSGERNNVAVSIDEEVKEGESCENEKKGMVPDTKVTGEIEQNDSKVKTAEIIEQEGHARDLHMITPGNIAAEEEKGIDSDIKIPERKVSNVSEEVVVSIAKDPNFEQKESTITTPSEEEAQMSQEKFADITSFAAEASEEKSDHKIVAENSCNENTEFEKMEVHDDDSTTIPRNDNLVEEDPNESTEAQDPHVERKLEMQRMSVAKTNQKQIEDEQLLASDEVSSSDPSHEPRRETLLESEEEEAQRQHQDLHLSALIKDSSMEVQKDVQLCVASTEDSDIAQERQRIEGASPPSLEERIIEETDSNKSDVAESTTNNEHIEQVQKDDTTATIPNDIEETKGEQEKPNSKQDNLVLDEKEEESKDSKSTETANAFLQESVNISAQVEDHFTIGRDLTINEEEIHLGKTAADEKEEARTEKDKGVLEETGEQKAPDCASDTPNMTEGSCKDLTGSANEAPAGEFTCNVAEEVKTLCEMTDVRESTVTKNDAGLKDILVDEKCIEEVATRSSDEIPEIAEITSTFTEGRAVETTSIEETSTSGFISETPKPEDKYIPSPNEEKSELQEVECARQENKTGYEPTNQDIEELKSRKIPIPGNNAEENEKIIINRGNEKVNDTKCESLEEVTGDTIASVPDTQKNQDPALLFKDAYLETSSMYDKSTESVTTNNYETSVTSREEEALKDDENLDLNARKEEVDQISESKEIIAPKNPKEVLESVTPVQNHDLSSKKAEEKSEAAPTEIESDKPVSEEISEPQETMEVIMSREKIKEEDEDAEDGSSKEEIILESHQENEASQQEAPKIKREEIFEAVRNENEEVPNVLKEADVTDNISRQVASNDKSADEPDENLANESIDSSLNQKEQGKSSQEDEDNIAGVDELHNETIKDAGLLNENTITPAIVDAPEQQEKLNESTVFEVVPTMTTHENIEEYELKTGYENSITTQQQEIEERGKENEICSSEKMQVKAQDTKMLSAEKCEEKAGEADTLGGLTEDDNGRNCIEAGKIDISFDTKNQTEISQRDQSNDVENQDQDNTVESHGASEVQSVETKDEVQEEPETTSKDNDIHLQIIDNKHHITAHSEATANETVETFQETTEIDEKASSEHIDKDQVEGRNADANQEEKALTEIPIQEVREIHQESDGYTDNFTQIVNEGSGERNNVAVSIDEEVKEGKLCENEKKGMVPETEVTGKIEHTDSKHKTAEIIEQESHVRVLHMITPGNITAEEEKGIDSVIKIPEREVSNVREELVVSTAKDPNCEQKESTITKLSEEAAQMSHEKFADITCFPAEASEERSDHEIVAENSCNENTEFKKMEVHDDDSTTIPEDNNLVELDPKDCKEAQDLYVERKLEMQQISVAGTNQKQIEKEQLLASDEVSSSDPSQEPRRETLLESEEEEAERQHQDLHLSALIKDFSMEAQKDVQLCVASTEDSDIAQERQKIEGASPGNNAEESEKDIVNRGNETVNDTKCESLEEVTGDNITYVPDTQKNQDPALLFKDAYLETSSEYDKSTDNVTTDNYEANETSVTRGEEEALKDDQNLDINARKEEVDCISESKEIIAPKSPEEVLESVTPVQNHDLISKEAEEKSEAAPTEIKSDKPVSEEIFEPQETMEANMSREKSKEEDEDADAEDSHVGSLKEELILESHQENEASQQEAPNIKREEIFEVVRNENVNEEVPNVLEEADVTDNISRQVATSDKGADEPDENLLANESIDRRLGQKEQGKSSQEVKGSSVVFLEDEDNTAGGDEIDNETKKDSGLLNENTVTPTVVEAPAEQPEKLNESTVSEFVPTTTTHKSVEDFELKTGCDNSITTQQQEIEERDKENEICTSEKMQVKAQETEMLSAEKCEEKAGEADTSGGLTEDDNGRNCIEAGQNDLSFDTLNQTELSQRDGVQEAKTETGSGSGTAPEISRVESEQEDSAESVLSTVKKDAELIEQHSEATEVNAEIQEQKAGTDSTDVPEAIAVVCGQKEIVSDDHKEQQAESRESTKLSTSMIMQENTVGGSLLSKVQEIRDLDELSNVSYVKYSDVPIVEETGPTDLQSASKITGDVQELNEGSGSVSIKENLVQADANKNTDAKVSIVGEEAVRIQQSPVSDSLKHEIEEEQTRKTSETVSEAKGVNCEEKKIIDNIDNNLTETSTCLATDEVPPSNNPQGITNDVAQGAEQEETQKHHGVLPILPPSDTETDQRDLPLHFARSDGNDVTEQEVAPAAEQDKHIVLEADHTENANSDTPIANKNITVTGNRDPQESLPAQGENIKPSKPEQEEANYGNEERTSDEKEKPESIETDQPSLSDLLQVSAKEVVAVPDHFTTDKEPAIHREELQAEKTHEEAKSDEEKESSEQQNPDSCSEAPVMVDAGDADMKAAHKKSHNLLSGVGLKMKHSIAKVKKAITGKSSHPKPPSPK